ncbi:lachesin [Haematobia irritans]|uniref:Putative neural cell adhesion molecule 1 n=1 Tax=Haematobia irritans TaxID=7368 RepID=A0A1L8EIC0_HAEIR
MTMNMQTGITLSIICLVLGFISSNAPNVVIALPDGDRSLYFEDYYDDLETSSGGPEPLTDPLGTVLEPPYFIENEVKISSSPDMDVMLNCDVKNFHANNVIMWYKDTTAIIQGQFSLNSRYENLKNNSILLRQALPSDSGNYFCTVLPQNITQNIILTVEKFLTIYCDGIDVLDRQITYRQGESHKCVCRTPGSESNNIKWYLNSRRSTEAELEVDNNTINLNNIDEHHSGIYQCLDDDGSPKPRHGMFELIVYYAPKVTTHRHHVNTEIGGNAQLYCDYRGEPIATTRWMRNNNIISYSEKHMMSLSTDKLFNRSTLTVNDVTTDDLGEYKCLAENTIGSSELRVHLMLEPEKGQFEDIKIKGNVVTLYWLVRSLQPLSEAVLDYKMTGSYTWSTTTVLHTHRHEDGIWKVTHEMELLPGEWQTRMKTRNTKGWSKFSTPYIFTINDVDERNTKVEIPPNIIADVKEKVAVASFGGGNTEEKSTDGAASLTRTSPTMIYMLLLLLLTASFRTRLITN